MDIVVAVDKNWGIGYENTQPIVIPEDRKHFRRVTGSGTVIAGRKTLADFPGGKPLPGRRNIVLSRDRSLEIPGAEVVSCLDELFEKLGSEGAGAVESRSESDGVYDIGGESVYRLLLPYCRYAYLTKIYAAPPADTFFPDLDKDENWVLESVEKEDEASGVKYAFMRYENKNVKRWK